MKNYRITTDSTADLPPDFYKEHSIGVISLFYTIEDKTYNRENPLPEKDFYSKMRAGSLPTTAQINPDDAYKKFREYMETSDTDLLHIAFSSGLSGSYNSTKIAAEQLKEEYRKHQVVVIDSLAASLGEGLLVYKAIQNKQDGMSLEENVRWLEENKQHIIHNFTVDDLNHLYRGGRVSKTAAVLGTMISLKPILIVDNDGHLIPTAKVRGRKKSLTTLVDHMEKQMGRFRSQNDVVCISHGDCYEDAQFLADLIKERLGIKQFIIYYVGPTIGAHSGPGTIALFYLGENR
jgi:DegV family protein with EDD domain